jgi:hypothetical protein
VIESRRGTAGKVIGARVNDVELGVAYVGKMESAESTRVWSKFHLQEAKTLISSDSNAHIVTARTGRSREGLRCARAAGRRFDHYSARFGHTRQSPRHWPDPPVFGQPSDAGDGVICPE